MTILSPLLLASHNKGKLKELKALLPKTIKILSASDFSEEQPEEYGSTFYENAAIKATFWRDKTGIASLADDAGICIEALEGKPGVYSKEFLTSYKNYESAFKQLSENRAIQLNPKAYCVCVLVLALPGGEIKFYEGNCHGVLVFPPRGTQGHGYDPIFKPDSSNYTYAEMTLEEKNLHSHRSKAFQFFLKDNFL
jgi:XTP/dITP diphosphohydrolase